jgi:hypothetical protein
MFKAHRYLAVAMLASVVLASSACASQGVFYRDPGGYRGADERSYARGYDAGRRRGEIDARRSRSADYSRYGEYRDADDGYRAYGDRNAYRRLFRQGFVAGYSDGYRRYARSRGGYGYGYPSSTYPSQRYASPATQNGYRDGIAQGRDDARDGDRYDPIRARRYRSGDHDYSDRYGPREEYKREYRAAFQQGYEQGYREYRR